MLVSLALATTLVGPARAAPDGPRAVELIEAERQRAARNRKLLRAPMQAQAALVELRREVATLEKDYRAVASRVPETIDDPSLLRLLAEQAAETGLEIRVLERLVPTVDADLVRIPTRVRVIGSFAGVARLLQRLQRSKRALHVDRIRLGPTGASEKAGSAEGPGATQPKKLAALPERYRREGVDLAATLAGQSLDPRGRDPFASRGSNSPSLVASFVVTSLLVQLTSPAASPSTTVEGLEAEVLIRGTAAELATLASLRKLNAKLERQLLGQGQIGDAIELHARRQKLLAQREAAAGLLPPAPCAALSDLSRVLTPRSPAERDAARKAGWRIDWDPWSVRLDSMRVEDRRVVIRGKAQSKEDVAELAARLDGTLPFAAISHAAVGADGFEITGAVVLAPADLETLVGKRE